MSTVVAPALEQTNFWEFVDNSMHAMGIHCGMPPGVGEAHITTTFKPLARLLETLNPLTREEEELDRITDNAGATWVIHTHWTTSRQWNGWFGLVIVLRNEATGRFRKIFLPRLKHVRRWQYLGATLVNRSNYSVAKAERQAQRRLFKALNKDQREAYLVSDAVVERGRSGVAYLIRKNKPTVAFRIFKNEDGEEVEKILCALCLHPVGYYTESWAGVTPPSDEVLAHLLLIRSSEHFYWRQANQIPPDEENSGI